MARPFKTTCDYFPHYTEPGKTLFTIERKYGNDGYSVLFKTFEMIGKADHHFIELNNPGVQEYFTARCGCDNAIEIVRMLANMGTFDFTLLQKFNVIYSEAFVNNLKSLYARRGVYVCSKADIEDYCIQKYANGGINDSNNDILNYIKLNKSKLNKSTVNKTGATGDHSEEQVPPFIEMAGSEEAEAEQSEGDYLEMNYKKIIAEYNEKYGDLFGRVEVLSDARRKKLKILNNEIGFDKIIPLFEKARASDFLRGKNNRGWTATFDWVINLINCAKILSGNYDNRGGGQMAGGNDYMN